MSITIKVLKINPITKEHIHKLKFHLHYQMKINNTKRNTINQKRNSMNQKKHYNLINFKIF